MGDKGVKALLLEYAFALGRKEDRISIEGNANLTDIPIRTCMLPAGQDHACRHSADIKKMVKGLMIESYIEDGAQKIGPDEVYGKSITDPCLGWEKTQRLIFDLADLV